MLIPFNRLTIGNIFQVLKPPILKHTKSVWRALTRQREQSPFTEEAAAVRRGSGSRSRTEPGLHTQGPGCGSAVHAVSLSLSASSHRDCGGRVERSSQNLNLDWHLFRLMGTTKNKTQKYADVQNTTSFIFTLFLNFSITVDLQYYVSFRCTA